jgi:hypothetical protein
MREKAEEFGVKSLLTSLCLSKDRKLTPKGGITPLWKRGAGGDFWKMVSGQLWTP